MNTESDAAQAVQRANRQREELRGTSPHAVRFLEPVLPAERDEPTEGERA
jgi:hypothetical protein